VPEFVQVFISALAADKEPVARRVIGERLRPALLSSPGCRAVELFSGGTNDGDLREAMMLVRWAQRSDMEASLG